MLATIPLDSPTHFSKAFQPIDNSWTSNLLGSSSWNIKKIQTERERERERESLGNLINSDSISIREIIRFFHLWEKERNSICWMDRYQHAPLRFASCKEKERECISRQESIWGGCETGAKRNDSLLSSVISGENCVSLSLSPFPPGGGKRKKELNVQGSSISSRGDGRIIKKLGWNSELLTIYWIYGRKLVSSSALYPACTINSIN